MGEIKKHYLITGGAGFIGSNLIRALVKDEELAITCIDDFDPFYPRQLKLLNIQDFEQSPNLKMLDRNLDDLSAKELEQLLQRPVDVIIHLAAKAGVRPSISDPLSYQRTNILGTEMLLDFARNTKVKQFVFASSSSVYGVNKNLPWKENEQLQPISPYAMTKLAGEMAGHVASALHGIRFIALRFFTVYGPSQRPDLAIHKFVKSISLDRPIPVYGDGSTSRDYTYVDDIVQGIIAAISYDKSMFEIINLGNNHGVSLKELIASIEGVIGRKATINRLPEQPGDVPVTYADITKAQQLLNYHPATQLLDGLNRFYQWFTDNKELLLNSDL